MNENSNRKSIFLYKMTDKFMRDAMKNKGNRVRKYINEVKNKINMGKQTRGKKGR